MYLANFHKCKRWTFRYFILLKKARYIMQSVNLNRVCARYPVCSTGTLHRTMQRCTMTVLWPEKYVYWPLPHHLCLTSSKGCTQKRYIIMYLCSYRRSSPALQNFIKTSANQTIDFFFSLSFPKKTRKKLRLFAALSTKK